MTIISLYDKFNREHWFIIRPQLGGVSCRLKKVFIRNRILKAATAEFLHAGYQKASLRNIAVEAHITPGNIYRYFKGKSDLYQATVAPALGWNSSRSLKW